MFDNRVLLMAGSLAVALIGLWIISAPLRKEVQQAK